MARKQRVTLKKLWDAIRKQCVECMGGQRKLIDGCTAPKCPLYDYRNGWYSNTDTPPESHKPASGRGF